LFIFQLIYQLNDAFHVLLVFFRNVTGPVNPTVVGGHFDIDAFEVATDWLSKVLADDSHQRSGEEDDHASFVEELEQPIVNVTFVEL
jgi:hypothetical protein